MITIMSQMRGPSPQYLRLGALGEGGDASTAVSLSKAWNEERSRPPLKRDFALSIGEAEMGLRKRALLGAATGPSQFGTSCVAIGEIYQLYAHILEWCRGKDGTRSWSAIEDIATKD